MKDPNPDDTLPLPSRKTHASSSEEPAKKSGFRIHLDASGLSDRGAVREDNQDHFLVARVGRSLNMLSSSLPAGEVPEQFGESGCLLMVADGMGGAAAGEVASRTAISALINTVLSVPDWIMQLDEGGVEELSRRAMAYYQHVNSTLVARAEANPELTGMGTTMTVTYCVGADLFLAHVGDSRAYLYRAGALRQLTRDHTHVQELVDAGTITREEAGSHRLRHVLTNVMGGAAGSSLHVEMHRMELMDGDRLLLCTDGLTEVVADDEIAQFLNQAESPEAACRSLVDLALERGGPDNVTVVAARGEIEENG